MKFFFDNLTDVQEKIRRSGGVFLIFDFDGVLSAIAATPEAAVITEKSLALLKKCADIFPTAILTGRSIKDIKRKISLESVFYVASHGLEWSEGNKYQSKKVPAEIIGAVNQAKQKIKGLLQKYPGMVFENKPFMLAAHYRIMKPNLVKWFKKDVMAIFKPLLKRFSLRLDHNKKTFELRPEIGWDKGQGVIFIENYFRKKVGKKFTPLYVGDGLTDEDAFKALKRGITIRVRPKKGSAAKYYFKSRAEVDKFLNWLSVFNK